jgi:two-component system nitrogen regulation response regulator GlnG
MKPIWIIDDDRSIRWVFEKTLTRAGLEFKTFASAQEALAALETSAPQVVVSDIRMPGESGLELLQQLKQRLPTLPVIIMTAHSDLESAVAAFQGGAFEYLPKPFDIDHAVELIRRAVEESMSQSGAQEALEGTPEILGQAPAMQEVFRAIGRLSQSHVTVLINGESGSGKELVARALHRHSPRADKPFIAINTAAIPRDLLESELFGHERGAFTGANTSKPGLVEAASGGTLFLDEVGDIPLPMQVKLLRLLESGTYRRVGSTELRRTDVRVVSATHRDLKAMVADGRFREDLYYRLSTFPISLPPLRDRADDIPLLAVALLARVAPHRRMALSATALARLQQHPFPGNVRELRNVLERAALLADGTRIEAVHVESSLGSDALPSTPVAARGAAAADVTGLPLDTSLHGVERAALMAQLKAHRGSRAELARKLGISERSLYRKLRDIDQDSGA